jgi:hypothetical protein
MSRSFISRRQATSWTGALSRHVDQAFILSAAAQCPNRRGRGYCTAVGLRSIDPVRISPSVPRYDFGIGMGMETKTDPGAGFEQ